MSPDRLKNLPTLDASKLKKLDGSKLAKPWDGRLKVNFGDGETDVTPNAGYRSPRMKRTVEDLREVNEHAVAHLVELPADGESYHYLVGDRVSLWDIVPALLDRVKPAVIRDLYVSTLSFGSATATAILGLIDDRQIERIHLLVSVMFSAKNKHLYDELIPPLLQRGQKAAAMRTHAKILAIELANGEKYVVESSSNLRTCHCAEQVTVIRDDGLYGFHRDWITNAIGGKKK